MRILIVGPARCGSTWVANVLGRAPGARMVYEPDGDNSDVLGAMAAGRLGQYPVMEPGERSYWYRLVWDTAFAGGWPWDHVETARAAGRKLARIPPSVRDAAVASIAEVTRRLRPQPRHVVVKTVNAMFALDWIASRYQPTVLILKRNPLNIISSWLVLDMWVDRLVTQHPAVVEQYLTPLGMALPNGTARTPLRTVAWNVGLLTLALREAAARHPEWIVDSYDDLAREPEAEFRRLSRQVGLTWSAAMQTYLQKSDTPGFAVHHGTARLHPNSVTATLPGRRREQQGTQFQRRLTPDQVAEARAILNEFDLGSWGPPGD